MPTATPSKPKSQPKGKSQPKAPKQPAPRDRAPRDRAPRAVPSELKAGTYVVATGDLKQGSSLKILAIVEADNYTDAVIKARGGDPHAVTGNERIINGRFVSNVEKGHYPGADASK